MDSNTNLTDVMDATWTSDTKLMFIDAQTSN